MSRPGKIDKCPYDRNRAELIRKRRKNLFKRLYEFNDLYGIKIWCVMQMPTGRIYDVKTNPDEPMPSAEETKHDVTVIHKASEDYVPNQTSPLKAPPALPFSDLPRFFWDYTSPVDDEGRNYATSGILMDCELLA
ncbi:transcriptional regulator family: MADS-box [Aspergillus niger]|nr:transcriptional regulator family: MADS-box [Aspergillus niger]